jgi:hypothetical protein
LVVVTLAAAIVFLDWPILSTQFLYDDYIHIADARRMTWQTLLTAFGRVNNPPGLFLRPVGFLLYWLNYLVARENAVLWHATSLLLHWTAASLVYLFSRSLRFTPMGCFGAALLFAVSGASVESVAWIDARFDPMAACFLLISLLCSTRYLDSGRKAWLAGATLTGICAALTKESGFCIPLLTLCLWFFRPEDKRRLIGATATVGAAASALFAYRWWALGGLGGYGGELHPIHLLNALFLRFWTILFYPVNWSAPPNLPLTIFLWTSPIALQLCAWKARAPKRTIAGCMALTFCAALPVQQLLLIGADLANTRILYMSTVGWALLCGAALTRPALIWLVLWHSLMLHHNLTFWQRVPREAQAICAGFAQTLSANDTRAVVSGLPTRKDGVHFLSNGFPECVAANGSVQSDRVSTTGQPNYIWNAQTGAIESTGLSKARSLQSGK